MTRKENKIQGTHQNASKGIAHNETPIPRNEPLDVAQARLILETIVGIHENSLTDTSDLTRVGPYDTNQMRKALCTVAQHIITSSDSQFSSLNFSSADKQTPEGRVNLVIFKEVVDHLVYGEPQALYMSLSQYAYDYLLECEIPLMQIDRPMTQDMVRFSDFREGKNIVTMHDMVQEFSIDKYRHFWRGTRWLASNLLDWNSRFRLPEELDTPVLPQK